MTSHVGVVLLRRGYERERGEGLLADNSGRNIEKTAVSPYDE